MKKYILIFILILVSGANAIARGDRMAEPENKMPIVAWHGISAERAAEVFPLMREAGVEIYLGRYGDLETTLRMLDAAQAAGVKLMPLCPELKSDTEATVKRLMDHPALYGYYLKDEPETWDLAELGEWMRRIQAVDSAHPCYVNLYPNWAWGVEEYAANLDMYVELVPAPFISFDQYPVVEIDGAPSILRSTWYRNLEEIAAVAERTGLPVWAFAMAWSHDLDERHHYAAPTLAELRLQMFSNLAYGAQTLQYFTFRGAVDENGQKTPVYDRMRTLNSEIQGVSGVFLGAELISVGHTGEVPDGARPLGKLPAPIKSFEADGGTVVSLLENGGRHYFVVVNRDYRNPVELTVVVDKSVRRVSKEGSIVPAGPSGVVLDAGDMIIYTWKNKKLR